MSAWYIVSTQNMLFNNNTPNAKLAASSVRTQGCYPAMRVRGASTPFYAFPSASLCLPQEHRARHPEPSGTRRDTSQNRDLLWALFSSHMLCTQESIHMVWTCCFQIPTPICPPTSALGPQAPGLRSTGLRTTEKDQIENLVLWLLLSCFVFKEISKPWQFRLKSLH